jgi:hypothetical protein
MLAPKLEVVNAKGVKNPVYNSVKRFSLDGLSDLIRVLMESVDDAMFELSDKVKNDRERNMYMEAMREIRLKRDGIKKHFDYEMQQRFDAFVSGKSATDDLDDEEELTLVELDELEDSIAIENMISKARPRFEDDLFAVSERLKLVLKRKEISEDENPLDPKAICESFDKASQLLETDIQAKLIFYKLFEKYVMNNLDHFYKELNELFVKKGVLPGFKPDQERMKQTSRYMANRIKKNGEHGAGAPVLLTSGSGASAGGVAGVQVADVVESPVVESPVVESPVVESPVVESPVVESPVVESPVVELLVVELLVAESPMVELLVAVELPLPVLVVAALLLH